MGWLPPWLPLRAPLLPALDDSPSVHPCCRCEFGTSALPHAKGASKKRGGAHHSFEERVRAEPRREGGVILPLFHCPCLLPLLPQCEALTKKLKAKLPGAMVKANKMLCKCAGCCNPGKGKDSCYFPVVEYGV